mgnify:CR=1 FL=1
MSYIVLARKWRPSQFDDVVGQGHVARTLKNAIEQNRVAHAFLFAGPRGVGKTSTARILAKALNCKNGGPTTTPCDACVSCVEIKEGRAVDVFEIDGASNRGINEIRELRESVRYAPNRDNYKLYIIDEVHMLTTEAFNALLKTLEEPPPHAKFVFATTEPQKIPVTILSRCQRYDFKRVGQQDIVEHLQKICASESIEAEKGALQIIARQAAGGMRDALSLLDQIISFSEGGITEQQVGEVLGVANRRQLFELSGAIIERDAEKALQILDDVNRYGYDLPVFATELVSHFRDLNVIKVVGNPADVTDLTDSEIEAARAQITDVPTNLLQRFFAATAEATQELSRSSFPKLVFEMTVVRLTQLEPLDSIDLLVDRLRALEGELDGDAAARPRPERSENPKLPQPERSPEARPSREEPRPRPVETRPEVMDVAPPTRPEVPRPAPDTPHERWREVVARLAETQRPLATTCEHAFVERFEDGVVALSFADKYVDFIREPGRMEAVEAAIGEVFGGTWRVTIGAEDPEPDMRTLSREHDAELRRRLEQIEAELRNHVVIKEAQSLFEIDPESVRVKVKLFEDEQS